MSADLKPRRGSTARPFYTYRGWRRNRDHGRRVRGNTKPAEREAVRCEYDTARFRHQADNER